MTKTILITGATDGVGLLLARYYAAAGQTVFTTGRKNAADAPKALTTATKYIQADQTLPDSTDAIVEALSSRTNPKVDIAILNAGVGHIANDLPEEPERIEETLTTNMAFTIKLAHELNPFLTSPAHDNETQPNVACASLALIGSTARKGAKTFPTYAASKAALHGFGRALHQEWKAPINNNRPCNVGVFHPGPTRTSMHTKAGLDTRWIRWAFLNPTWVAAAIVHSIETGKHQASMGHRLRAYHMIRYLDQPVRRFRSKL